MIIGIHGLATAGKDTVGSIIIKEFPHFARRAFADKLKVIAAELLTMDPNYVFTGEFKQTLIPHYNIKGRDFLQKVGTDALREHFSEDIWVNALLGRYQGQDWVITDVRFKNEANRIKELGGILIRVDRNVPQSEHITENDLRDYDKWDLIIDNNDTLEQLATTVKNETSKLLKLV